MAEFGALLVDGAVLAAASNSAYAFGTGDFSVEILVQSVSAGPLISCMGNGGAGSGGFLIAIESSGVLKFVTSDGTSTYAATTNATAALDGDWHHVAGVRQNGALSIYFDGVLIPSVSPGGGSLNVSTTMRLLVGGTDNTSEPVSSLNGTVDDVAIWSRALTASDIITGMFERIVPSASTNLVGYWTLEDSLEDTSATGNDLVPNGDVEFILVSHWTAVDFAAQLTGTGVIAAPTNAAYNIGTGDFTVGGYVQTTTPGTIISRQGPLDGAGYGGFLLTLEPSGQIKFLTTDGANVYQAMTGNTLVFDGSWHHVAGARVSGVMTIFLDGEAVPSTPSGAATPLNINSSQPLVIGGTDDPNESSNEITGSLYDVCIWNVGLGASDLDPWLFGQLTGSETGLVGYYSLDDTTDDLSATANNATANASVTFGVVFGGLQTAGANSYAYCSITSDPPPVVQLARNVLRGDPSAIVRQESIVVQAGSPALVAALNTAGDDLLFPLGVTLTVTDPNGVQYNSQPTSATVWVANGGDGNSIAQLIVLTPIAGTWIVSVTGTADARFQCQISALPSQNVVSTMQSALGPMYPANQANMLRVVRDAAVRVGVSWSCWWCVAGAIAVAVIVAAIILVISAPTGGGGFLVALGAVATLCGIAGTAGGAAVAGALILAISSGSVGLIAQILCMYMGSCMSNAPSLQTVVSSICATVGVPARAGAQATRANAGINADYPITIDSGGEGPKPWDNSTHFGSMVSGFANAINLNDKTQTTGGPPTRTIPLLVQVAAWETNPGYPFANGFANYVTMQSAPLMPAGVTEMARIVAPGGRIGLWIDTTMYATEITQLATALNSTAQYNAPDEFNGHAGYPKTLIVNKR
jgi:hypothetical protein